MKLGTENRRTTIIAVVLTVIALLLLVRMLLSSSPATAAVDTKPGTAAAAAPAASSRPTRDARSKYVPAVIPPPSLDPRLRLELLKDSEEVKYEGSGRNVFTESMAEIPAPRAPGLLDEGKKLPPGPLGPPAVPPAPRINLKFYGWASKPGEPKKVFLAQGSDVFVAREGEVIAGRYKVLRINSNSVDIEDLLSNNRQSIPFTG